MILVPFFSWIVLEHDHVLGAYYFVSNVLFCLNYLPKLWNCHHTYLSQHEFYKSSVLQNLNGQWSFGFMGGPPSLAKLGSNISLVEEEISGFKFFMWHHKTAKKPVTQRHSGAGLFRKKKYQKKHLCYHDKKYCYFCKSYIPVINLIVYSRNMIKISKTIILEKIT